MSITDIVFVAGADAEAVRQRDLFDLALGRIAHDGWDARGSRMQEGGEQPPPAGVLTPALMRAQREAHIREAVQAGLHAENEARLRRLVDEIFNWTVGGSDEPVTLDGLNDALRGLR